MNSTVSINLNRIITVNLNHLKMQLNLNELRSFDSL